jgi:hypothetical protein
MFGSAFILLLPLFSLFFSHSLHISRSFTIFVIHCLMRFISSSHHSILCCVLFYLVLLFSSSSCHSFTVVYHGGLLGMSIWDIS